MSISSPQKPDACFWTIIPAGGSGTRFSSQQNKLAAPLASKPVIWHSISAFLNHPWISGVIVLASESNCAEYQSFFKEDSRLLWGVGGHDRRASVWNGLLQVPSEATHVLIHDAARPLVSKALIEDVILAACSEANVGAIAAFSITDTLKKEDISSAGCIEKTIDRKVLWGAQTPQAFKADVLKQAHQAVPHHLPVTDDAQLIELASLGYVQLCASTSQNLKITTESDLLLAQALWNLTDRVGL
jgi:2-C-methyl-D-erythritol 4-phosphate cytidylyltransferase